MIHAFADGFGRASGGVRILVVGKELVKPFDILQGCGRPNQSWHSGAATAWPASSLANQASAFSS
jgi:hypothetical protein